MQILTNLDKETIQDSVLEMLESEGYKHLDNDCVRITDLPKFKLVDVVRSIEHVKSEFGSRVIVFNKLIDHKKAVEDNCGIMIIDQDDLKLLCIKYKKYDLYDKI